ncbi:MAG: hypothetical protein KDD66_03595 [Bdellovibrionales bacterium]|nr:hypothetical protein [Bdellovibrionales bacterium]
MKTISLNTATVLFVMFAFSACSEVANSPAPAKSDAPATENAHVMPPDNSSAELNRIKALEGKWKSTTSMFGKENEEVFTEYKITAGGAAVVETIFPGTPQEMVSVYFDDDNGKLSMTHYCMMRNRPHFTLAESNKGEIKMDVTKVEGLKTEDTPSMGAITLKFQDKDHFSSTCESGGKSEHDQGPMTMHFTRVD